MRASRIVLLLTVTGLLLPAAAFAQEGERLAPGLLPEPRLLRNAVNFVSGKKADNGREREGVYPELGSMITGAGWISGGPGYRQRLFGETAVVDVSGAVSWRFYKTAQARFELPSLAQGHLGVGTQALWRDLTQVSYSGLGPDSFEAARSDYRLHTMNIVGYAVVRSGGPLSVTGTAGWLRRPRVSSSTGPFDRDLPDTTAVFRGDPAVGLPQQPAFLHGDLTMLYDTRDHPGHARSGGLYRGAWVGYRDRDGGLYTFARYETEGARFVPLARGRLVIALHGLGMFSMTSTGRAIPFYLLPSLGGHNTLRGYADYRFHDRHLLVANVESRFPLLTHVDGAVFVDAGNVAPRVKELDLARTSYGAGMRLHTGTSTLARLDIARGDEGWRLLFRLSDPLRLARLSRRTAAMPFVP